MITFELAKTVEKRKESFNQQITISRIDFVTPPVLV